MPLWNSPSNGPGPKPRPKPATGTFEGIVAAFCFACFAAAFMSLIAAFNAAEEKWIVATTPWSDAVVARSFYKQGKGRPRYLSIRFDEGEGRGTVCDVDLPAPGDGPDLAVGRTIEIVRTTPGCDPPILVGHVPSVGWLLAFGLVGLVCGSGLFLFRRYLAELRRALEPWDPKRA